MVAVATFNSGFAQVQYCGTGTARCSACPRRPQATQFARQGQCAALTPGKISLQFAWFVLQVAPTAVHLRVAQPDLVIAARSKTMLATLLSSFVCTSNTSLTASKSTVYRSIHDNRGRTVELKYDALYLNQQSKYPVQNFRLLVRRLIESGIAPLVWIA